MIRLALLTTLVALPAFATGERIVVSGAAAPLEQTLCLQMTCVHDGAKDFVVTGTPVAGAIEIQVTTATGQRRLTERVAMTEAGTIGSMDLVRLTAQVFTAIEQGPVATPAPKRAAAAKKVAAHKALRRALAHR